MKTILLCNLEQSETFRENAGLPANRAVRPTSGETLRGVRFSENDLILEWPGWRDTAPRAQEIVDSIKVAIARSGNAGPEWVSSDVLTVT